ncbi:MAG: MBL fold metallo-hydrolase, partial [Firmicutes bacterium]|nr:MBL fold metallo-hydrolase [Bacillota bacterium]
LAAKIEPKLLVTYHHIYHMNIQDNTRDLPAEMDRRNGLILEEIRGAGYHGPAVCGKDLDIFTV